MNFPSLSAASGSATSRVARALLLSLMLHALLILPANPPHWARPGPLDARLAASPRAAPATPRPPALPVRTQAAARPVAAREAPAPAVSHEPRTFAATETDVVDGDGLRAYRMALALALRPLASAVPVAGHAGRVGLGVVLGEDGMPQRVDLARSSGDRWLDEQALAMARDAVARTDVPGSLRGQAANVLLEIDFSPD